MNSRLAALTVISLAVLLSSVSIASQAPPAKPRTWTAPRLADGRPDLSGYWSNNTIAPLERPAALAGKEFLTEDEARVLEREARERTRASDRQASERPGEVGDYNAAFKEDSKWALPNGRTSIITDPKDGRMPPLTPEARKKFEADQVAHKERPHDGPEDMTTIERCITWISSGPPMLPTFYNNNYHIVQTRDYLIINVEMIHDVRIIPLDGRPHLSSNIRYWEGDARGRWEGDTFVITTTGFNDKGWLDSAGHPQTESLRVTERQRRRDFGHMDLEITIDDSKVYTRPFTVKMRQGLEVDTELVDEFCLENEKSYERMQRTRGK